MGLLFVRFIGFLEDNQNRAARVFLPKKELPYHGNNVNVPFFLNTQTLFALATSSRGAIKIPCSIVQVSTALLNNLVQKSMGANFFYSTS